MAWERSKFVVHFFKWIHENWKYYTYTFQYYFYSVITTFGIIYIKFIENFIRFNSQYVQFDVKRVLKSFDSLRHPSCKPFSAGPFVTMFLADSDRIERLEPDLNKTWCDQRLLATFHGNKICMIDKMIFCVWLGALNI